MPEPLPQSEILIYQAEDGRTRQGAWQVSCEVEHLNLEAVFGARRPKS